MKSREKADRELETSFGELKEGEITAQIFRDRLHKYRMVLGYTSYYKLVIADYNKWNRTIS